MHITNGRRKYCQALLFAVFFSFNLLPMTAQTHEKTIKESSGTIQDYAVLVQTKIKNNWKSSKCMPQVCPIVKFKILPDGKAENIQVIRSSGVKKVDELAIETTRKSAPFPPINASPFKKIGYFMEVNLADQKSLDKQQFDNLVLQADRSLKAGNWQLAVIFLTQGLQRDPDNVKLKRQLSSVFSNQANIEFKTNPRSNEAAVLAKRAYALDPSNSEAKRIMQKH